LFSPQIKFPRPRKFQATGAARRGGLSVVGHEEPLDLRRFGVSDGGGVNPTLTIQAIACRTADRIKTLAARGEL
jgi:hypothetical protein